MGLMGQSQGVSVRWEQCFCAALGALLGAEPHPCSRRSAVLSFPPALMELTTTIIIKGGFFSPSFSLSLSLCYQQRMFYYSSPHSHQPPNGPRYSRAKYCVREHVFLVRWARACVGNCLSLPSPPFLPSSSHGSCGWLGWELSWDAGRDFCMQTAVRAELWVGQCPYIYWVTLRSCCPQKALGCPKALHHARRSTTAAWGALC